MQGSGKHGSIKETRIINWQRCPFCQVIKGEKSILDGCSLSTSNCVVAWSILPFSNCSHQSKNHFSNLENHLVTQLITFYWLKLDFSSLSSQTLGAAYPAIKELSLQMFPEMDTHCPPVSKERPGPGNRSGQSVSPGYPNPCGRLPDPRPDRAGKRQAGRRPQGDRDLRQGQPSCR